MNKLNRLQIEKNNLESALEDFTVCLRNASEKKVRRMLKFQIDIIKSRLSEFNLVLSIINIEI